MSRGGRRPAAGVLAAALALAACGRGTVPGEAPAAAVATVPVPEPDLAHAEPAVRQQIATRRDALDALAAHPDADPAELAQAYGDLGLVYIPYDFLAAAAACFDNAAALAPDDYRWVYLQGYLRGIQGHPADAAPFYRRTLERRPDFLPAVLRLARADFDLGDLDAAEKQFRRALELDAGSAAAEEGLGRVAAGRGRPGEAAAHLERALERQPSATAVRYALGQAYRDLGRRDEAEKLLATSGDVTTRIPDPLIAPLAELAAGAQFYIVQGAEALDDGDYRQAADAYREATQRDPDNLAAYQGWGFSLEKLGDAPGAVAALEAGLARGGAATPETRQQRLRMLAQLGALEAGRGRDGAAVDAWRHALELDPGRSDLHLRVGDALARQGRFAEAVASYDRALAAAPAAAAAQVLEKRATAQVNLGHRAEAVADFRRAVSAAPGDAQLRLRFAAALEFLGDAAGAARQRGEARRLAGGEEAPALVEARAQEALRSGDWATAAGAFRSLLERHPDDAGARYGLASALGAGGRYDEAAAEFDRLVAAEPRHGAAHRGRIKALVLGGRYGAARMALQEALKNFPRDAGLALTQVHLLSSAPDPRVRDGALAVEIAERLTADRPDDPAVRHANALALAAAGRTADAATLEEGLADAAAAAGDAAVAARHREIAAAFRAGRAWRAERPEEILAPLAG